MEKATAVLLNYERPENLPKIIMSLPLQEFINEVIIWDNSGDKLELMKQYGSEFSRLSHSVDWITIKGSKENLFTAARFEAAKMAKNEIIVTQDDDVIVNNWLRS